MFWTMGILPLILLLTSCETTPAPVKASASRTGEDQGVDQRTGGRRDVVIGTGPHVCLALGAEKIPGLARAASEEEARRLAKDSCRGRSVGGGFNCEIKECVKLPPAKGQEKKVVFEIAGRQGEMTARPKSGDQSRFCTVTSNLGKYTAYGSTGIEAGAMARYSCILMEKSGWSCPEPACNEPVSSTDKAVSQRADDSDGRLSWHGRGWRPDRHAQRYLR